VKGFRLRHHFLDFPATLVFVLTGPLKKCLYQGNTSLLPCPTMGVALTTSSVWKSVLKTWFFTFKSLPWKQLKSKETSSLKRSYEVAEVLKENTI